MASCGIEIAGLEFAECLGQMTQVLLRRVVDQIDVFGTERRALQDRSDTANDNEFDLFRPRTLRTSSNLASTAILSADSEDSVHEVLGSAQSLRGCELEPLADLTHVAPIQPPTATALFESRRYKSLPSLDLHACLPAVAPLGSTRGPDDRQGDGIKDGLKDRLGPVQPSGAMTTVAESSPANTALWPVLGHDVLGSWPTG